MKGNVPSREPIDSQKELLRAGESKVKKYQRLVIGSTRLWDLAKYELTLLTASWIPGALGLFLRTKFYPMLLQHCGKNVAFGTNVTLRHPNKIRIGNNVVIDDNCVLDAKGTDNSGISIHDNVFIGRNTIIYCQNGDISIGENANIGSNCQIFSAKSVTIGKDLLMGAYSYLVGGGHDFDELDVPIIEQGRTAHGIRLGQNIWVGAGVNILDGTSIGEGVIIAAGAVVKDDVPDFAVVGGIPAKLIKDRRENEVAVS
jgi:acetyltransferase-like isoleucine patch superfamily enzyme